MDMWLDYLANCISLIDTFIAVLAIVKIKSEQSAERIAFTVFIVFILQIGLFLIISYHVSTAVFLGISLLILIVFVYLGRERVVEILRDPSKIRRRWYIATVVIVGSIIQLSLLNWAFQDKEKLINMMKYNTIPLSTTVSDRQGNFSSYFVKDRLWLITHDQLPQDVVNLAILEKDPNFFEHPGFEIWGSETITQYIVRNNFLKDNSFREKIHGYLLALIIEQLYSKGQILQTYVNTRSFSGVDMHQKYSKVQGIETAAYTYFHKKTSDLTLAEAAFLFSLPASDAYSQTVSYEDILKKQNGYLEQLHKNGKITSKEKEKAQKEKLAFSKAELPESEFLSEVKNELIQNVGESMTTEKGLRVLTTQDTTLETSLRSLMKYELSQIGSSTDTLAVDVLILDHTTGEVITGFNQRANDQTSSSRPFSRIIPAENSMKLFVYLQAFDNRMLSTGKRDTDVYCFTENEYLLYCPPNIAKQIADSKTNDTYTTIMPLIVLIKNLGQNTTLQNLEAYGIRFPGRKENNLPSMIKSSHMQFKDAAQLHALFMNEGKKQNLHFVSHVTDKDDKEITLLTQPSARKDGPHLVSPQALEAIYPIFQEKTVDKGTMFPLRSSNDTANWIIGTHSPYLAVVSIRSSDFSVYENTVVMDLVKKILDTTIKATSRDN